MITRHGQIRSRWRQYRRAVVFSPLLLTTAISGCAKDTVRHVQEPQPVIAPPATVATRYPSLAGTWEYEESGKAVLVTLNEYGNGAYQWKDGEFITTTYVNGVWKGLWSQRENDRDGGFEVRLSQDGSEGEGRWWYTRIGSDTAPTQTGGVFQITRQSKPARFRPPASDAAVRLNHHGQVYSRENQ